MNGRRCGGRRRGADRAAAPCGWLAGTVARPSATGYRRRGCRATLLRRRMVVPLVLTLTLTLGLIVYGLFAWERIVARRRASDPGTS